MVQVLADQQLLLIFAMIPMMFVLLAADPNIVFDDPSIDFSYFSTLRTTVA